MSCLFRVNVMMQSMSWSNSNIYSELDSESWCSVVGVNGWGLASAWHHDLIMGIR
jgi:hypothetical protein